MHRRPAPRLRFLRTTCALGLAAALGLSAAPAHAGDDPRPTERELADAPAIGFRAPPYGRSKGKLYLTAMIPDQEVLVVDLDKGTDSTIPLPEGSQAFWLDRTSDSQRLFVTSPQSYWIYAIDLATRAIVDKTYWGTSDVGMPMFVTVNPGDASVTVTELDDAWIDTLDAADLDTMLDVEQLPGVATAAVPAYRPGTLDLYTGSLGDGRTVTVRRPQVDWNTGEIVNTWGTFDIPTTSNQFAVQDSTYAVDFLTEQRLVVVSNMRGYEIAIVDEDSRKTLVTEWAPANPRTPTVDPRSTSARGRVFVPSPEADQLMVYNVTRSRYGLVDLTVEAEIFDVCSGPTKVVFADNDWSTAYVACNLEVLALDAETLSVVKSYPMPTWGVWEMVWAAR